jgi:hypothetical protein
LFKSVERYNARANFGDSNTGTRFSCGDAPDVLRNQIDALREHPRRAHFFGSYLRATAKCVGLTITTSAVGTLCIMRRRASVCCI